jgi:hypothetical protein
MGKTLDDLQFLSKKQVFHGARCQSRTGTPLRTTDFKSVVSTIPPSGHIRDTNFSLSYNQEEK